MAKDTKKQYETFGTNQPGEVPQHILERRQAQIDSRSIDIVDIAKKGARLLGVGAALTAPAVIAQHYDQAPSGSGNVVPIESTVPLPDAKASHGFVNSGLGADGKVHIYYNQTKSSAKSNQDSGADIQPGDQAANGNIIVENAQGGYSVETPAQNPQAQSLEDLKRTGTLPTDHQ